MHAASLPLLVAALLFSTGGAAIKLCGMQAPFKILRDHTRIILKQIFPLSSDVSTVRTPKRVTQGGGNIKTSAGECRVQGVECREGKNSALCTLNFTLYCVPDRRLNFLFS